MKIAIPRLGDDVAPCFEYTATIVIFTMEEGEILGEREFRLQSELALDRARLLEDQGVDVLICGGISARFEDLVRANGVEVVSWVSGTVSELLGGFARGTLTAGTARLGHGSRSTDRGEEAADA